MENVVVVIGAGQIGQAIARRVGVGKHIDEDWSNGRGDYQEWITAVGTRSRRLVYGIGADRCPVSATRTGAR